MGSASPCLDPTRQCAVQFPLARQLPRQDLPPLDYRTGGLPELRAPPGQVPMLHSAISLLSKSCRYPTLCTACLEVHEKAGSVVWACVITFSLLVAAGIGFPIPEELPIIGAGIWVGNMAELGPARWLILPVCIAGVVISDGLLYGVGRYFGPKLLEW